MDDARARVCVIGSLNMDIVVRVEHLPRPGETVTGRGVVRTPGGKGGNQAVAAARAGADVRFVGAIGSDEAGAELRATLEREGIDASRVVREPSAASGSASIAVSASGENTIIVAPGANAALSPAHVDAARDAVAWADVLLLQLEIPLESATRAAALGRERGATVILNAAPARALSAELLSSVDVLLVNETEADAIVAGRARGAPVRISGNTALPEGFSPDRLSGLSGLHLQHVVLTAGAAGAVHLAEGRATWTPAFSVDAVDTVGAGDAFAGVLATRWAEHQAGGSLDAMGVGDALAWASAAGALACTRSGAMDAMPTRESILAMLRRG